MYTLLLIKICVVMEVKVQDARDTEWGIPYCEIKGSGGWTVPVFTDFLLVLN